MAETDNADEVTVTVLAKVKPPFEGGEVQSLREYERIALPPLFAVDTVTVNLPVAVELIEGAEGVAGTVKTGAVYGPAVSVANSKLIEPVPGELTLFGVAPAVIWS